ncbi:MAG: NYN domain-containing protein [Candidatus Magasanikbacteria bacterium]|nr:NYN domain-containing protein [Candidatus Magasanikbacteria bacterium]
MPQTERVQIYTDGGNFYHLVLKKLNIGELDFSFEKFSHFLANGRTVTGKRYYVGTVREREGNLRTREAMSRQTKFFTVLHSSQWSINTSKLRTRLEKIIIDDRVKGYQELRKKGVHFIEFERTREKGIDVKLATDLIVGAIDNQYDTAIVVSSDADLVPAIDWVRFRQKKKVEYIGFSFPANLKDEPTKPLQTMISKTDIQRVLTESDLRPFIIENPRLL